MPLKTRLTQVPERYQSRLTEHIFKSPDYSLKEKGAQMKRGADGKFYNPLTGPKYSESDNEPQGKPAKPDPV